MASSIQTAFYSLALLVCGSLSTLTMKNLRNEMDQMEVDDAILVCLCGMLWLFFLKYNLFAYLRVWYSQVFGHH